MSFSINTITISGNLTSDARVTQVNGQNGPRVLNGFSIAHNIRTRNNQTGEWEEKPVFIDCSYFSTTPVTGLTKGSRVVVSGQFTMRSWTDQQGIIHSNPTINVNDLHTEMPSNAAVAPVAQQAYRAPASQVAPAQQAYRAPAPQVAPAQAYRAPAPQATPAQQAYRAPAPQAAPAQQAYRAPAPQAAVAPQAPQGYPSNPFDEDVPF